MPWTVCMSCMAPLRLGGESQHNLDSHTPLSHTRLYHNSAHTHTQLAGSHMHAPCRSAAGGLQRLQCATSHCRALINTPDPPGRPTGLIVALPHVSNRLLLPLLQSRCLLREASPLR